MSIYCSKIWRRKNRMWIRVALMAFLFIWLQLHFMGFDNIQSSYPEHIGKGTYMTDLFQYTFKISEIKQKIAQYNLQQVVNNKDVFQPLQNDSIVIVIQIHDRVTYLRHLIFSLAQASGINQTLLVFSHDYYNEEINSVVQSINFCKVIQIFYPYSIQSHPNEFPGQDPGDCPRDMKKEKALSLNCNNALYPDSYGHYREAKFTQIKHHWWWKANRVFSELEVTSNHTGLVVFLEEDHYVAEDFLYLLKLMERTYKGSGKECNILSLATYEKTYNYYRDSNKVEISKWISNMGMAFNRFTWLQIVECAPYFCKYDDYNWDWSLQHILKNCLKHKVLVMIAAAPRVFHIGECGVHHKKSKCEPSSVISKVQNILKMGKRHLFPDYLIPINSTTLRGKNKLKENGGWGDRRDHKLCMDMTVRL